MAVNIMINTYKAYLENSAGSELKIEDAMNIYDRMAGSIDSCKMEEKFDFWKDFLKAAAEYTKIRNDWEFMSREERLEADKGRSIAHDGFITSLNILSRIAENEEQDTSWRKELGEERKRLGDFACFVTYITGISNR